MMARKYQSNTILYKFTNYLVRLEWDKRYVLIIFKKRYYLFLFMRCNTSN